MWRNAAWLFAASLILGATIGWAQQTPSTQSGPLPRGKNVEMVMGRCIICHSLETVAMQRLDRAGWEVVVERMISYGAPIPPDDKPVILDYLAAYLGP